MSQHKVVELFKRMAEPKKRDFTLWGQCTGMYKVFRDTYNGVYWEAYPAIEGHAYLIQSALLPKYKGPAWL